jgi:anaerobic selenocysteine-containing dehydrogenase
MEITTFDDLSRNLGSTLTRRSALRGLVASVAAVVAGGALVPGEDAAAKTRRRKSKNRKQRRKQNTTPDAVVTCPNLGTACGLGASTLICNCRLTKEGTQTCANVVNPPNGTAFESCTLSTDCPSGQICDFGGNVCRTICKTA